MSNIAPGRDLQNNKHKNSRRASRRSLPRSISPIGTDLVGSSIVTLRTSSNEFLRAKTPSDIVTSAPSSLEKKATSQKRSCWDNICGTEVVCDHGLTGAGT